MLRPRSGRQRGLSGLREPGEVAAEEADVHQERMQLVQRDAGGPAVGKRRRFRVTAADFGQLRANELEEGLPAAVAANAFGDLRVGFNLLVFHRDEYTKRALVFVRSRYLCFQPPAMCTSRISGLHIRRAADSRGPERIG